MEPFNKILLVRFGSLGDVLLTTPLIRALRLRLPNAEIEYFTKSASAPLLHNNPHLSRVHELKGSGISDLNNKVTELAQGEEYDLVVDLHRNPRSWFTRTRLPSKLAVKMRRDRLRRWLLVHWGVDRYERQIDLMPIRYFSALDGVFDPALIPDELGLDIYLTDEDRREASEALGRQKSPIIAIAPSAHWPTKRWLPERFAAVADRLSKEFGAQSVLIGGAEDRNLTQNVASQMKEGAVNLAGELSVRGTAAVIERSLAFVGNDTGLMHIASALNRPGVAIFGPTTRHLGYYPYGGLLRVVEAGGVDCRPCTKQGDPACPKTHFDCMASIPVEEVFYTVRKSIEEASL